MKIFSELIIDSCFQNSEHCTCSIFRMISASSIFAIVILHHFACKNLVGLGAPNLRCRVPVEELKPCQAFLIKMFEAPISKSIVYARKFWKVKERATLISYRPLFLTVGHRDAQILSASNPSRWRIIKPKPSCLVIGGPVDHPSQNCKTQCCNQTQNLFGFLTGYRSAHRKLMPVDHPVDFFTFSPSWQTFQHPLGTSWLVSICSRREFKPNSHHSSGFSPMFWGCGKRKKNGVGFEFRGQDFGLVSKLRLLTWRHKTMATSWWVI